MAGERLSRLQARILLLLAVRHPRSLQKIADALGAAQPSVHHSSVLLRERGLMARDEDGWGLTPAGAAALPEVRAWLRSRGLEDVVTATPNTAPAASVVPPGGTAGA